MTEESRSHGRGDDAETADTAVDQSRRRFLQGTGATLTGIVGFRTTSQSASAASRNHLLVVGHGPDEHTYEIQMKNGGQISKGTHAGSNDTKTTTRAGAAQISGSVWHWNLDSYTYSGSIAQVEGDGTLAFHFLDGAFQRTNRLSVTGKSSGRHDYSIGTNDGDIDLGVFTKTEDSDDGKQTSERSGTPDYVTGIAWNNGTDSYSLGEDAPVQHIKIEGGHLKIKPASSQLRTGEVDL